MIEILALVLPSVLQLLQLCRRRRTKNAPTALPPTSGQTLIITHVAHLSITIDSVPWIR